MLKKLFLASLVCGLCFGADGIDFNGKVTDELKLHAIANSNIINDEVAGKWYLNNFESSKYDKVINDEFERAEAFQQGKEALEKLKEQYKNLDTNKTYIMLSRATFGEYNFEKEEFPIEFITEDSYFNIDKGKIKHCTYTGISYLVFDNVDTNKHVLKMEKDEANKFLKSRKTGTITVDRSINVDVEFSLSKAESSEDVKEITDEFGCLDIKVTGHIKKLTLTDQKDTDQKSKKHKVLSTIEYE